MMLTEGNSHLVYATGELLIFRSLGGDAPDFVYRDHTKKITALSHYKGNEYAFGDAQGGVVRFTFAPDTAAFAITK